MRKKILAILPILLVSIFLSSSVYSNQLTAHIIVSNQPDGFKSPNKQVYEFVINEPIYIAFAATGLVRDKKGMVNAYTDVEVITANNEVLFSLKKHAGINQAIPVDQKGVIFSPSLDITFEQGDSLGMYTVKSKITDTSSNTSTKAKTTILLFESKKSKQLIMSPVKDAKHLDLLWAHYFKTKNPWAVKSIIKAIRLKDSKNLETAVVGSAAIWSLESNAFQHSEVYSLCQGALKQTKGSLHKDLEQLIKNVDEKKRKDKNV